MVKNVDLRHPQNDNTPQSKDILFTINREAWKNEKVQSINDQRAGDWFNNHFLNFLSINCC